MRHPGRWRRLVPWVAAAVVGLGGVAMGQPSGTGTPKTAGPKAGGPKRPGAARRQGGWPKTVPFGELTMVIDEPQAESLEGTKLKAHGTFEVKRGEDGEVTSGTAWYEAEVEIDRDGRTVTMASVEVPKVEMAGAPPQRQQRVSTRLKAMFNNQRPKLPLDDVLASTLMASRNSRQSLARASSTR